MTDHSTLRVWRQRVPKPLRSAVWKGWARLKPTRPGLIMRYARTEPIKVAAPPPGYAVRAFRPGDECEWLALLNVSGAFGDWDELRLSRETRDLLPDAQVFAEHEGRLVAATGVLERPLRGKPALEMAWVTRDPREAGKGLGRTVFIRSLHAVRELYPRTPVYLYTDDHRLTAIAMYLDLGFTPELRSHRSYPVRWERVFIELARRGRHA